MNYVSSNCKWIFWQCSNWQLKCNQLNVVKPSVTMAHYENRLQRFSVLQNDMHVTMSHDAFQIYSGSTQMVEYSTRNMRVYWWTYSLYHPQGPSGINTHYSTLFISSRKKRHTLFFLLSGLITKIWPFVVHFTWVDQQRNTEHWQFGLRWTYIHSGKNTHIIVWLHLGYS